MSKTIISLKEPDLLMFVDRKEKVTHINSDKVIGLKIRATLSTNQMQSALMSPAFSRPSGGFSLARFKTKNSPMAFNSVITGNINLFQCSKVKDGKHNYQWFLLREYSGHGESPNQDLEKIHNELQNRVKFTKVTYNNQNWSNILQKTNNKPTQLLDCSNQHLRPIRQR